MLPSTSMANRIRKHFRQLPANCSCVVESAHHAKDTVLISEHSIVTGVLKSIRRWLNSPTISTWIPSRSRRRWSLLELEVRKQRRRWNDCNASLRNQWRQMGLLWTPVITMTSWQLWKTSHEIREQYPTGTFKNLFWEQPKSRAQADSGGTQWW